MCHEYGMRWWKSEAREQKTEKTRAEAAKPDLMTLFAPQAGQAPLVTDSDPIEEKRVEEKQFAPAK